MSAPHLILLQNVEMGIVCNLPSTINIPNDSPPALFIFFKCSKKIVPLFILHLSQTWMHNLSHSQPLIQ